MDFGHRVVDAFVIITSEHVVFLGFNRNAYHENVSICYDDTLRPVYSPQLI